MTAAAVLLASLLGSLHCASMCGGFCTAVAAGGGTTPAARRWGLVLYHLGRLVGYAALAVGAGAVGLGLRSAGELAGLHDAAGILMGIVLIAMALHSLLGRPSAAPLVQLGAGPQPGRIQRGLTALLRRGGGLGAAGIGLASALLPCGWLWSFVVLAAATGSITGSLTVIAAFWLGTLPALLSVGFVAGWLRTKLGRHAPKITAVVLLGLGVLALAGRLQPMPAVAQATAQADATAPEVPPCHRH
jgi:sulfite exporter TauE/SafE